MAPTVELNVDFSLPLPSAVFAPFSGEFFPVKGKMMNGSSSSSYTIEKRSMFPQ